jgi:YD repeat-containing protein
VSQTPAAGRQSFTTLDSLGRVRVVRTPGLDSVVYSYDTRGRLSQVQTGGRVASYTYDSLGRLATTTDPLGRTDSLFYDDADRLTRQVLPGGREIAFAYDSSGNLTSVTPPSQPAHLFKYTSLDLDSLYDPPSLGAGTWATQYRYDLDGSSPGFSGRVGTRLSWATRRRPAGRVRWCSTAVGFPGRLLLRLPSGDSSVITNKRSTVRSDSAKPFTVVTETDSTVINGQLWRTAYEASRSACSMAPAATSAGGRDTAVVPGSTSCW